MTEGESYNDIAVETKYSLQVVAGSDGTVRVIDFFSVFEPIKVWKHNLGGFHLTKIEIVDTNTILIWGLNGCFYKSTDRGVTFSPHAINSSKDIFSASLVSLQSKKLIIVGGDGIISNSTDTGQTWSAKSSSTINTNINLSAFSHVDEIPPKFHG